MAGRPSEFTAEVADLICDHIADGKSLRSFCETEGNPDKRTVLRWVAASEEFRSQYAQAREMAADSHADDVVDIGDTEPDPAKARVRIDARKWAASKMAPRKYGERLELAGQVTVARVARKPLEGEAWEQQHAPPTEEP